MEKQKEKSCFKCHSTKLLNECKDCNAVFCVQCAALPFTGGDIPEALKFCIKCGSANIIHLEYTFKQK